MAETIVEPVKLEEMEPIKVEEAVEEIPNPDVNSLSRNLGSINISGVSIRPNYNLPSNLQMRIGALKKLQFDAMKVEADFHMKVYQMEVNYQDQFNEIYKKRSEIINGDLIPGKDDCLNPEAMQDCEQSENIGEFWLSVFKMTPILSPMVQDSDEAALKFLKDLRVINEISPEPSFTLEFHFGPNDFFTNEVLVKKYFMKCNPTADKLSAFDGFEIYKATGCDIDWKEGKKLTKVVLEDGETVKVNSFFHFFDPPKPEETNCIMHMDYIETDFEIGYYIKERVVPRAVLFYTGDLHDEYTPDATGFMDFDESDIYRVLEDTQNESAMDAGDGGDF